MSLTSGSLLGPYEILSPLGAGGMGEVYRARDTRLDRTVAIKIISSGTPASGELRERLQREARAISSLNHPHICTLHDVGCHEDTHFIVMEYVEGETLAERLKRGALPVEQSLRYATEIAAALGTAHRQGIIHRDLKPSNIMLTRSGAKLLDFGLAKLCGPEQGTQGQSILKTQSSSLTLQGTIVGTLQYMAPEQLEGKPVDARTDIFAAGAVLYEMATGHRAFEGESQPSVMARILQSEPAPFSKFQPVAPLALQRIVQKCLAKDPEERWQSASDLKHELEWIQEDLRAGAAAPAAARRRIGSYVGWAVAVILAAVLIGQLVSSPAVVQEKTATMRFSIAAPPGATFSYFGTSPTLSPDGRLLALRATNPDGKTLLWIRPLSSFEVKPLAGTEGATYDFFWSPDSHFIGFFADGKLKKIDIRGGKTQILADAADGLGGAWSRSGFILYAPSFGAAGLYRISDSGGEAVRQTTLDTSKGEIAHRWPRYLPDGRHFGYLSVNKNFEKSALSVGLLDSNDTRDVLNIRSSFAFAEPGYLLYVRDSVLYAQPFDFERLATAGGPVQIAEGVYHNLVTNRATFSVSDNGVLSYWRGGATEKSQFLWLDRFGAEIGPVGPPGQYAGFALSPDGSSVAFQAPDTRTGTTDIWTLDLARGVSMRITSHPSNEQFPVWSTGGDRLVFMSDRFGREDLYQVKTSGAGADELLYESAAVHIHPQDWSRGGRHFLYEIHDPKGGADLWILPMFGDRKPFPCFQSAFSEHYARFSPDAQWIAYSGDDSRVTEIYLQPFPATGRKWRVSTNGGDQPLWRADGAELFYVSPGKKLMAVEIKAQSGALAVGIPRLLFEGFDVAGVTADGRRFLANRPIEGRTLAPINVVVNWTSLIEE